MNKLLIVVTVIFVAFMISCNADEDEVFEPQSEEILCFESYQEYSDELEKVIKMNYEERQEWQEDKGFKLMGIEAEKFYWNIDFSKLSNMNKLNDFVANNNQYIQIIKDEYDDIILETKLYKYPERFLVNKDYMFQIKNDVYKVFEDGIVKTDVSNICKLQNVSSLSNISGDFYEIIKSDNNSILKSTGGTLHYSSTGIDEDEKVHLDITYREGHTGYEENEFGIEYPTKYTFTFSYSAKAYHEYWIFWVRVNRFMTAEINAAIEYTDENGELQKIEIRSGELGNLSGDITGQEDYSVSWEQNMAISKDIIALSCCAKQSKCDEIAAVSLNPLYFELENIIVHPPVVFPFEIPLRETDFIRID